MTNEVEQIIHGAVFLDHEVRFVRYGPSHNPRNDNLLGIALKLPGNGLRRVYVDPKAFAEAVNAAGIVGLTVTYEAPPEPAWDPPTARGTVVQTSAFRWMLTAGGWTADRDRSLRYSHEEFKDWVARNHEGTPTVLLEGEN